MKARKRFGQHFLEPAWVNKLIVALEPVPSDRFIEIGPGRGAVTVPLAAKVAELIAVEVDRDLAAALESRGLPNVTVVTGDVLTEDLGALARRLGGTKVPPSMSPVVSPSMSPVVPPPVATSVSPSVPPSIPFPVESSPAPSAGGRVRVVGNLPYNISSPILFRLLEVAATTGLLQDATLMLQKEVADRLVARRGTGEYGVLTLSTALGADVATVLALPPGAFRPPPKVRSSVVRLTFRPPPPEVHDPRLIVEIVRAIFTQRRKMLSNALAPFARSRGISPQDALVAAGIDPHRRPETLALDEVARLADAFAC